MGGYSGAGRRREEGQGGGGSHPWKLPRTNQASHRQPEDMFPECQLRDKIHTRCSEAACCHARWSFKALDSSQSTGVGTSFGPTAPHLTHAVELSSQDHQAAWVQILALPLASFWI